MGGFVKKKVEFNGNELTGEIMKGYVHDLCVFTEGLMNAKSQDDDLVNGIGIGMCTALTMLANTECIIPFNECDLEQIVKMLKVGKVLLSDFEEYNHKNDDKDNDESKEDAAEKKCSDKRENDLVDEFIKELISAIIKDE